MRLVRDLILLLLLLPIAALAADVRPLLGPAALNSLLERGGVRVIDVRDGRSSDGRSIFDSGHVPGSMHAPYRSWRGPAENPGQLPSEEDLTSLIRRLGIEVASQVVVVFSGNDSTDFGAAARVYWTLRVAGLENVSILDGGMRAWAEAGLPLSTAASPVAASNYTARLDRSLIATREDIAAAVASSSSRLVDARPESFFSGNVRHAFAKVPGTIRGAESFDSANWFAAGTAQLLPLQALRDAAAEAGFGDGVPIVSFCNTGHWAATNWFVLSELLGAKQVRLYPESMVDWSRAQLPMDNVPGRAKQLWMEARMWWARNFD